jgi:hypothetical protein
MVLADDQVAALFRVLWYVERVDALCQPLRSPLRARHVGRIQGLLLDSIAADLETWQSYLDLARGSGCSWPLSATLLGPVVVEAPSSSRHGGGFMAGGNLTASGSAARSARSGGGACSDGSER